jgi:hypothetical protein
VERIDTLVYILHCGDKWLLEQNVSLYDMKIRDHNININLCIVLRFPIGHASYIPDSELWTSNKGFRNGSKTSINCVCGSQREAGVTASAIRPSEYGGTYKRQDCGRTINAQWQQMREFTAVIVSEINFNLSRRELPVK